MKQLTFFILVGICLGSCKSKTNYNQNYHNSSPVAYNLIKQCVDTMINIDPAINTKNYVLDLSSIDTLNKRGVDSFLYFKSLTLPTKHEDSTIIFKNGNLDSFYIKQTMIIKFRNITFQNIKTSIVNASKIKSSDEIINAKIDLERHSDGYKIKNVTITR